MPYSKAQRVITEQRSQVPNLPPPLQRLLGSILERWEYLNWMTYFIQKNRWKWFHPPESSSSNWCCSHHSRLPACPASRIFSAAFAASLSEAPSLATCEISAHSHSPPNFTRIECFLDWQGCVTREHSLSLFLFLFLLVWLGKRRRRFLSSVPAKSDGVMEERGGRCVPNVFWRLRCGNYSVCSILMLLGREREREIFAVLAFLVASSLMCC